MRPRVRVRVFEDHGQSAHWNSRFACDVFLLLSRRGLVDKVNDIQFSLDCKRLVLTMLHFDVPKEEFKSNEKCQLHVVVKCRQFVYFWIILDSFRVRIPIRNRRIFPSDLMYGSNTGTLKTIRIRREFVSSGFELSGRHCICVHMAFKVHVLIFAKFCLPLQKL